MFTNNHSCSALAKALSATSRSRVGIDTQSFTSAISKIFKQEKCTESFCVWIMGAKLIIISNIWSYLWSKRLPSLWPNSSLSFMAKIFWSWIKIVCKVCKENLNKQILIQRCYWTTWPPLQDNVCNFTTKALQNGFSNMRKTSGHLPGLKS